MSSSVKIYAYCDERARYGARARMLILQANDEKSTLRGESTPCFTIDRLTD
ncbi:hypothetical protein [Microbacterium foliorum]|uniref:hypothetical protein n=1 Tax=Microbacterium foliorum TaxID=104336 RepID=UPI001DAFFD77|nr:hypothetical protein [Microbacterium foliorum]CAH0179114.1 hypothetical protein SRABI03_01444 [Microbacterium foliorum]CAH0204517.1 hypothetical protein SRABI44_02011 [Microbacterium foliorum]